jgi:hypothetical protein
VKSANLAVRFLLAGHIVMAAALGAAMAINSALLVALV